MRPHLHQTHNSEQSSVEQRNVEHFLSPNLPEADATTPYPEFHAPTVGQYAPDLSFQEDLFPWDEDDLRASEGATNPGDADDGLLNLAAVEHAGTQTDLDSQIPEIDYSFDKQDGEPWNQWHMHSSIDLEGAAVEGSLSTVPGNEPWDQLSYDPSQPVCDSQSGHEIRSRASSITGSLVGSSRRTQQRRSRTSRGLGEDILFEDDDGLADFEYQTADGRALGSDAVEQEPMLGVHTSFTGNTHIPYPSSEVGVFSHLNSPISPNHFQFESPIEERSRYQHHKSISSAAWPTSKNIGVDAGYPGSIPIPTSSRHYQEAIAGSWPTTRDSFPPEFASQVVSQELADAPRITTHANRPRGNTVGAIEQASLTEFTAHNSRATRRSFTRKSRSNSFKAQLNATAPAKINPRKGGRVKPLTPTQAVNTLQKRQDRSVCIHCSLRRVKCERPGPGAPCQSCVKRQQLCAPSHSLTAISDLETCNCIFQTFSVYPTKDSTKRIIRYPTTFDVPALRNSLGRFSITHDIQVRTFAGSVWQIDTDACSKVLAGFSQASRTRPFRLQEMVVGKRELLRSWQDCIRPQNPGTIKFDQFITYCNMPSRNTYGLVARDSGHDIRILDVEKPEDESTIMTSISLCRVLLRALEITALKELQKKLEDMTRGFRTNEEVKTLINQTAKVLGSLRFRLAWWDNIEVGHNNEEYTQRTTDMAQALYFWYFAALKRVPAAIQQMIPRSHISVYADIGEVEEEHPTTESHEGFVDWMFQPYHVIHQKQLKGELPMFPQDHRDEAE